MTVGVSVVDPHCDIAAAGGQDDRCSGPASAAAAWEIELIGMISPSS